MSYKFILLIIAGAANGLMDRIHYRPLPSWLRPVQYWDPRVSWKNKWKDGDPANGERFFLSSTALVNLTDGWHMLKSVWLHAVCMAMSDDVYDFIIYSLAIRMAFAITYGDLTTKINKLWNK